MVFAGRIGSREDDPEPSEKWCLVIAVLLFGFNHLSVVRGGGVLPEALIGGCLAVLSGVLAWCGESPFARWNTKSIWRRIVVTVPSVAVSMVAAAVVAWLGYRQRLFG